MLVWALALLLAGGPHGKYQAGTLASETAQVEVVSVTLRYTPSMEARSVVVAGQFNGWNRDANPLTKLPDGKTWEAVLRLPPGVYQYKFVVNGDRWENDPSAPRVDDGNGNINSQLIVRPEDYARFPEKTKDDQITPSGIRHEQTPRYIKRLDKMHVSLALRTRHNDVLRCWLRLPGLASTQIRKPLTKYASDALFDYWRTTMELPNRGDLRYAFSLEDGKTRRAYDASQALTDAAEPQWFTLDPTRFSPLETPDWVQDRTFYQIFPDRFENGDPSNDGPGVQPWGSRPTFFNRMGGDLQGVLKRMDYLQRLGINGIYFNPIFAARSNHAYDTTDYLHVDPRFGTNETLKTLVSRAHEQGWKVILDGVFNHVGVDFEGFRDLQKREAQSPYKDWFFVKGFPLEVRDGQTNYVGWFGSPWMPKLNTGNPVTRDFLLDVGARWIREAGIDGWRLDAADEVPHDYWKLFRQTVRQANPDAYIVGEIWGDASAWLNGDEFDAVMNYRWRGAVLDFFAFSKLKPSQFDARLRQLREEYPPAATAAMFNMLDSHDTERVRTLFQKDWARQKQAVLFQMTYVGAPCIYYGDEIGMEGGRDPDERRTMLWDETQWNQTIYRFYRKVIALRNRYPVLRRGEYRTLMANDRTGVFGYARSLGRSEAVVLINRGPWRQWVTLSRAEHGGGLSDWLSGALAVRRRGDRIAVLLPPYGVSVLGR